MRLKVVVFISVLSCLLLPFNNCGAYRTESDSADNGGAGNGLCASDLYPTFQATYVPFFTEGTCITCHVPGGKAQHAPFAQPDTAEGYRVFINRFGIDLAPDRVYNKLKAGHYGPPFTDLESDLIDFSKQWQQSLVEGTCFDFAYTSGKVPLNKTGTTTSVFTEQLIDTDGNSIGDTLITLVLDADQGYQKIKWEKVLPTTTVTFQMDIRVDVNSSDAPRSYTASNLMIKSSSARVRVKDFSLLLNDRSYFVTTYSRINFEVPADNTFHSVGSYSSGIYFKDIGEVINKEDKWSIKVKTLDELKD